MSTFIVSLLNMSITASIIIVAVICIRFLLKKAPKAFSYALWGVVLLRLLCPITISSQFSVFNLLHVNTNTTGELQYISETAKQDSPAVTPETGTYVPSELPYIPLGGYEQKEYGMNQPVQFEQPLETQVVVRPNTDTVEELPPVVTDKEKLSLSSVTNIVGGIWIAGVIVILFVNVISYLKLRNKAAACMKLHGNVYLSDEIDTPFCLGFFPAKIYLPSSLGEQERRYILMHEEYHIKRFDHVVKLFAFLAFCIHWFNPLVWLAFVLAGKDMEMSCDEAVMRKMDTDIRAEYSTSLLHLATGRRFAPSPLSFGEGNPKDRIKNIMNYKKPGFWLVIFTTVVCGAVTVMLGTNPQIVNALEDVVSEVWDSKEPEEEKLTEDSESVEEEITRQEALGLTGETVAYIDLYGKKTQNEKYYYFEDDTVEFYYRVDQYLFPEENHQKVNRTLRELYQKREQEYQEYYANYTPMIYALGEGIFGDMDPNIYPSREWYFDLMTYDGPDYVSLLFYDIAYYEGAAHEMANAKPITIDVKSGEIVGLEDIFGCTCEELSEKLYGDQRLSDYVFYLTEDAVRFAYKWGHQVEDIIIPKADMNLQLGIDIVANDIILTSIGNHYSAMNQDKLYYLVKNEIHEYDILSGLDMVIYEAESPLNSIGIYQDRIYLLAQVTGTQSYELYSVQKNTSAKDSICVTTDNIMQISDGYLITAQYIIGEGMVCTAYDLGKKSKKVENMAVRFQPEKQETVIVNGSHQLTLSNDKRTVIYSLSDNEEVSFTLCNDEFVAVNIREYDTGKKYIYVYDKMNTTSRKIEAADFYTMELQGKWLVYYLIKDGAPEALVMNLEL